jgi:RNA polymerase subunit RPABC4/transcription elongation factor Spt4
MRYCNNCKKITTGEPLFCNFCGRSYDLKLCPQRHPNPRAAEICSQCGSREFSTPQPKTSIGMSLLLVVLSILPGLLLVLLSVLVLIGLLNALLNNQQLLFQVMMCGLPLAFLWWVYLHVPSILRKGVSKLLGRKHGGGDGHGH